MENRETMRLRARLLALNLRLEEVRAEVHSAQLDAHRIQSRLDDARLAQMMGEKTTAPAELTPMLESLQLRLEEGEALAIAIRRSRRQARVEMAVQQVQERRRLRAAQEE